MTAPKQNTKSNKAIYVIDANPDPGHATGGLLSLWAYRRLLWDFVKRDLSYRYTGSAVGILWTVITPLMELVTYTFVFHGLIGVSFQPQGGWTHYALFLFCGMVTWMAVSDGISHATGSVASHGQLIKKLRFPAIVLPAHTVCSATLNQLIRLAVLCLAALIVGPGLSWTLVVLPFLLLCQMAFTVGLAMVLATANTYYRDTTHWVNAVLLLWMFITPVFYPAANYPQRFAFLLQFNPLAHIVGAYREIILNHVLPHPHTLIIIVVMSTLSLFFGYSVFHHHRRYFSDLV